LYLGESKRGEDKKVYGGEKGGGEKKCTRKVNGVGERQVVWVRGKSKKHTGGGQVSGNGGAKRIRRRRRRVGRRGRGKGV